jgi:TP901 family phage tail tape measure protein
MQRTIGRFTRATQRSLQRVGRVSDKVAAGIKKGFMAAAAAMAAFGAAVGKVIEIGADFEQNIVSAAVKFPGQIRQGSEAFKELEDAARKTGANTEFSATQSAEALNFLAMAGFDAKGAIAALPGVVDLATAAGIELSEATDIASDSLGAFGLATKDATQLGVNLARVNDVLAATTTSANTNMEDMFEAIKEGASTATQAGASIETFSAMVAVMANAGIKGSKSGTTLKNVFLNLQAPAAAGRKALEKLFGKNGVINKETGALKDPIKIIGMLNEKLSKMGTAAQARVLKDIFGKIALPGALTLLEAGSDELERFRLNAESAAGKSGEMAKVMRDTTRGAINSLKSALEGVIISIFKLEDTGIKNTVNRMTDWIRANEKLIVSKIGEWLRMVIDNLGKIVKWIKIIAKAVAAFFILHSALKLVIGAMTIINALMAMNPIGLIILAVAALVAGLIALVHWSKEVAKFFDEMPTLIKVIVFGIAPLTAAIWGIAKLANVVKEHWEPIKKFFKVLVEFIKIVWEPVGQFFDTLWTGIVEAFDIAIDKIKEILEPVAGWIQDTFKPVGDFIENNITKPVGDFLGENIGDPVSGFFGFGDAFDQAKRNVAIAEGAGLEALPQNVSDENISLYQQPTSSEQNITLKVKTAEGLSVDEEGSDFSGVRAILIPDNGGF